jgi:hypothetical protein
MFGLGTQELVLLGLIALIPILLLIWVIRNFAGRRGSGGP